MYIQRLILEDIKEYQKFFPVLLISGARQVGKSTLALHLNIDNYITLDDINMYEMAKNNPKGFIESLNKPVVIDEIQRQLSLDEISFNQNFVVSSDVRKIRVEGTHAVEPIDVSKLNIIRL